MHRVIFPALILAGTALSQGVVIPTKDIKLKAPVFSLTGSQPFAVIEERTTSLFGVSVKVEVGKKKIKVQIGEGRPLSVTARSGKNLVLELKDGNELPVRIECVAVPGWLRGVPDSGLEPVWIAYPTRASVASFGSSGKVTCIDRDCDGLLWEVGEDAVVFQDSSMCIPLKEKLIVRRKRMTLSVKRSAKRNASLVALKTESMRGIDGRDDELAAVEFWNRYRTGVGLEPAWLDPQLSKDCAAHALYLSANPSNESAHEEKTEGKHYSKAGAAAARASCVSYRQDSGDAIRGFLSELYHKGPLLHPMTAKVGLAARHGHTLVDGVRGMDGYFDGWPVAAPGHEQTVTLLEFGPEEPDPRPTKSGGGATILLMFDFWNAGVKDVKSSLRRKVGKTKWAKVPTWLSDPKHPANSARPTNDGCVCIIPKTSLRPGTTYKPRIELTDTRTGKRRVFEWVFHTSRGK